MLNKNTEPIIVVQNPNSTNFKHVEDRVIQPLQKAGVDFDVYQTQYPHAEDNVKAMIDALPDNATIFSAAGDGTGEQVANASLVGDKDFTIGFLPFGNFNDMAYAHMDKGQSVVDLLNAPTIERTPLAIDVNGEHWRYAPAYVTLGLTARIAAGFDDEESREKMRRLTQPPRVVEWLDQINKDYFKKSELPPLVRSVGQSVESYVAKTKEAARVAKRLGQAAGDYFKYSQEKIPTFRINGGESIDNSTDMAIANNPIVAGMIRPSERYFDTQSFGVRADLNMANIFEAANFGLRSLAGHSPLDKMNELHVAFERASTLPVQTEGEYVELHDVRDIFVYKDPNTKLRVLHAKQS